MTARDPMPDLLAHSAAVIAGGGALRLTCYGSSTTEGYGASSPAASYPSLLADALRQAVPGGVALSNRGVSGETGTDMAARLDAVLADRADLVIWQTGSNDATAPDAGTPAALARFEALTRAGIAAIRSGGADLVIMDQQYSRNMAQAPAFEGYLSALHALAAAASVPLFPRHAIMRAWVASGRTTMDAMSPDGTHMTDTGYGWLARAIEDWLRPRLGLPARAATGPAPAR